MRELADLRRQFRRSSVRIALTSAGPAICSNTRTSLVARSPAGRWTHRAFPMPPHPLPSGSCALRGKGLSTSEFRDEGPTLQCLVGSDGLRGRRRPVARPRRTSEFRDEGPTCNASWIRWAPAGGGDQSRALVLEPIHQGRDPFRRDIPAISTRHCDTPGAWPPVARRYGGRPARRGRWDVGATRHTPDSPQDSGRATTRPRGPPTLDLGGGTASGHPAARPAADHRT